MKGTRRGAGERIYTADRVVVGVRVTIIKIKSLLNHDMKVECKCDDSYGGGGANGNTHKYTRNPAINASWPFWLAAVGNYQELLGLWSFNFRAPYKFNKTNLFLGRPHCVGCTVFLIFCPLH